MGHSVMRTLATNSQVVAPKPEHGARKGDDGSERVSGPLLVTDKAKELHGEG